MEIIQKMISPQGYFPGNPHYPLLIYKQVFSGMNESPQAIQDRLEQNHWSHSWVDSIYDFHHYHSNTHEVLVIISGECQVQFGGDNGSIYTVKQGDVVILPAGVAHKSLSMTDNFRCIGAYPFDVGIDMNYGNSEEYLQALKTIKEVGLPKKDPIFGEKGLIFNYWK
ncbi:Cupin domain protein [Legionella rubrilucens]|uniref:Cupin domain protein n=1 Tax=Legionella rubrilucens TaxID=458 RepID=A0A0W0XSW3_9GAMM|nr:cupin domain-containing protein [Legionella rubrilucens]KTD47873.1 Cupin domain protein [Legionella rubrilucens]